jgi:hypothetical protein
MTVKYTNIVHYKTLENLPKLAFFGSKINHLATLVRNIFFDEKATTLILAGFDLTIHTHDNPQAFRKC